MKHYASRSIFWAQFYIALAGIFLAGVFFAIGQPVAAIAFVCLLGLTLNRRSSGLRAVTLSVPEILADVVDAFKIETPMLFGGGGFGTDFSSKTAVLGDKITAKISHVPLTGSYDANNGGFKNAVQDVTTLIEDVPVTLDQFRIVTIRITWLQQLASKLALYKEAIRNYGFALGKYVTDYAISQITAANFSNQVQVSLNNLSLDTFDSNVRDALNLQKASGRGRYCLLNTPAASKLGSDDRVRSSLFYGALNGDRGYRQWNNLAGFTRISEYTDMFAGGNLIGYAGDSRGLAVATRSVDFSNAADELGIPKVMQFYPVSDAESGLNMTGAAWQEAGTADVFVALGLLFGVGAGKQNGANGVITDNAGIRIVTP